MAETNSPVIKYKSKNMNFKTMKENLKFPYIETEGKLDELTKILEELAIKASYT